jgi:hypothetical protein
MANKNFEVKLDVQKGALGFGDFVYNRCAKSIELTFSSIVFGVCIWVLDFYKLEAHVFKDYVKEK